MNNRFVWTMPAMIMFGAWGFFHETGRQLYQASECLDLPDYRRSPGGKHRARPGTLPAINQPYERLYAFLASVTGVLGTLFYYIAAYWEQISIVVILTALTPLVTIPLTLIQKQIIGPCFAVVAINSPCRVGYFL